jgi:thioredoxin-related protein
VDGLETKYKGRLSVIRLDVTNPAEKEVLREFGFEFTPTFIFYDAKGQEIWRSVGNLDLQQLSQNMDP